MKIKSMDFVQFAGQDLEWKLQKLLLGSVNLIVGRNATGKSKTLNVIGVLASLLAGERKPDTLLSGEWDIVFEHDQPPVVRPPFKFLHADKLIGAKVRVSG